MKYKNPNPKNLKDLSELWEHSVSWKEMIKKLMIENEKNPLVEIKSIKNIEQSFDSARAIMRFILSILYFEIPHQMGKIQFLRIQKENEKLLTKEKKIYSQKLLEISKILDHWQKTNEIDDIFYDEYQKLKNAISSAKKSLNDILDPLKIIQIKGFDFTIHEIKLENELFNKKYNLNTNLRDLVIKYLVFTFHIIKISFISNYEKYKFIYNILIQLFNSNYKEFDLMGNLFFQDLRLYINEKEIKSIKFPHMSYLNFTRKLTQLIELYKENRTNKNDLDSDIQDILEYFYAILFEKPYELFREYIDENIDNWSSEIDVRED